MPCNAKMNGNRISPSLLFEVLKMEMERRRSRGSSIVLLLRWVLSKVVKEERCGTDSSHFLLPRNKCVREEESERKRMKITKDGAAVPFPFSSDQTE